MTALARVKWRQKCLKLVNQREGVRRIGTFLIDRDCHRFCIQATREPLVHMRLLSESHASSVQRRNDQTDLTDWKLVCLTLCPQAIKSLRRIGRGFQENR